MPPTDSPAVVPPNYDKIFKGYSYVAPSVLFSKNVISDEILKPAKQHDSTKLINCKMNNSQFFQTYDIDLNEPILGDGTFSVCRKCVNLQTGKEYAVKIVSRKKDCSQEINLLRACQGHPNIVTLHDVIQDEGYTYLVLEYLKGGELFERIRKKSKFTEAEASAILRKLVSAVSFMHSCGVVHRDLKPENLVFTSDEDDAEIKVIDFGFARLKQEKESLHTPCFTLHYAAPEVLKGDPEGYDENCDLWSLGVILYSMLSGKAPFHARSREESVSSIMERIKEGDFSFNSPAWTGVSHEAKSVVRGLLTVNPGQRLRMNHLETNSWVQGSQNFVSTPLMTPDVLMGTQAEKSLQTTFNAFHKAEREGFRLQDVLSAKLAQRRRMKKSSSDNNSTSSSSFTSEGSLKSGPKLSFKTEPKVDLSDSVFNFGENRVTEFLDMMSAHPETPSRTSSKCDVRESTSSSGIVMSDKNSVETKVVKRQKKVYVQTRRSERIRRQRLEIDMDPAVKDTRKRKVDESEPSIESSASSSKRKKAVVAPARKTKKSKITR